MNTLPALSLLALLPLSASAVPAASPAATNVQLPCQLSERDYTALASITPPLSREKIQTLPLDSDNGPNLTNLCKAREFVKRVETGNTAGMTIKHAPRLSYLYLTDDEIEKVADVMAEILAGIPMGPKRG